MCVRRVVSTFSRCSCQKNFLTHCMQATMRAVYLCLFEMWQTITWIRSAQYQVWINWHKIKTYGSIAYKYSLNLSQGQLENTPKSLPEYIKLSLQFPTKKVKITKRKYDKYLPKNNVTFLLCFIFYKPIKIILLFSNAFSPSYTIVFTPYCQRHELKNNLTAGEKYHNISTSTLHSPKKKKINA